jgi:hypothetical protein
MTTIKIDGVEISIEALEKLGFVRKEKVGRYIPADGSLYSIINHKGIIDGYTNNNDDIDKYNILSGNCYRTEEEAEHARDKQLATVRVLDRLAELSVGFDVVDFKNETQNKFYLIYNSSQGIFAKDASRFLISSHPERLTTNPDAWPTIIKEMEGDLRLMMGIEGK